jgi:hypothetical protein
MASGGMAQTRVRDAEAPLSGSCGPRLLCHPDGVCRNAMYAGSAAGSWNKKPWPPS